MEIYVDRIPEVWSVIPGRLMQVDVSPANDEVWGVSSYQRIWRYIRSRETWQRIPGSLKHVSVDEAGVWGVNKYNQIWYRKGVGSTCDSAGVGWIKTNGEYIIIRS